MPNRVGQQLSQYYLTRLLGRSAIAELYLAEHTVHGTEAAVKVLQVDLSAAELESFLRAARTLPNLVHSNVLQVIEVGLSREAARFPFLVMEYTPNGSLRQRHPVGSQLPPLALLAYVRPLAEALHAVHLQGFVHGDVKPENILIGSNDQILLSDCSSGLLSLFTETVTGTVAYMAPELFRGELYPASDQYALGIMIYEWLCGALPFNGALREMANQQQFVPPPSLSARTPGISSTIEEVILKALAKEPGERFGSVLEFADAFDRSIMTEYGRPLASSSEFAPYGGWLDARHTIPGRPGVRAHAPRFAAQPPLGSARSGPISAGHTPFACTPYLPAHAHSSLTHSGDRGRQSCCLGTQSGRSVNEHSL